MIAGWLRQSFPGREWPYLLTTDSLSRLGSDYFWGEIPRGKGIGLGEIIITINQY